MSEHIYFLHRDGCIEFNPATGARREMFESMPPDGVPCKHPGCLHHISHPCGGCGRIGGRYVSRAESKP